jgi:tetratricopeptide (TPR) repeat protein
MARWRDWAAGKELLLVLDDAASSEQVRPLLPGTGGSLVLVTSRRHLMALDDATSISLDSLPPGEAAALLVRLAGRPGLSPDDPAVAEITRLCGYLPLAVGMVARQLHHHPAWTAGGRADALASARDRLDLLVTENVSVAAAFDLSYEDLDDNQRRLFRRLGLHLGTDVDDYAAAALDGSDLESARRGLDALYDQHLLTEPAQGRYRMHDLIREHARALAGRLDPDDDRDAATSRLLAYYQHTAMRANALIALRTRAAPPTADGTDGAEAAVRATAPVFKDSKQALAWAKAERTNLLACLDHTTCTGEHARVIGLTASLSGLLRREGYWTEAITRNEAAIRAARQLGDRPGEANALRDLGRVRILVDDYWVAVRDLEQSLDIYHHLGDRAGQADTLNWLGTAREGTCDHVGAALAQEQALEIHRDLGNRIGEANALNELGTVRRNTDDYPAAARAHEQALDIYRDLGDRLGEGNALIDLGTAQRHTGDYPAAARSYEQALDVFRERGNRLGEANVLGQLGVVRRLTGDYPAAADAYEQALDIYHELGERLGRASTLGELGVLQRLTGDFPSAARNLEQALDLYQEIGHLDGETETLSERATLYRVSGDLAQAEECYKRALGVARLNSTPRYEAHALAGLGRCALAAGHATQAETLLRQALEIFQRIGAGETSHLLADLSALVGPDSVERLN